MSEQILHTKQTNISENKNIPVDALVSPPISLTTNEDCMDMMSRYPNKFFELAVVDPPYGININNAGWIKQKKQANPHTNKNWDNEAPDKEYFDELFRVSKNQIIWGGNYFDLPPTRCYLIWDKVCRMDQADCEFAWTSFNTSARIFTYAKGNESGFAPKLRGTERAGINIHPTQKPIALYSWVYNNYARRGNNILDTHLGSGSSRIAAWKAKLNFYGCEIDEEYYNTQEDRFKKFVSQLTLW